MSEVLFLALFIIVVGTLAGICCGTAINITQGHYFYQKFDPELLQKPLERLYSLAQPKEGGQPKIPHEERIRLIREEMDDV